MMSFAVLAIVKATLVCGVAFFFSRLCRRTRASIRHLLFALAFTALVAIPGAGPLLPTVAVTVPARSTPPAPRTQEMASAVRSTAGALSSRSSTRSVSRDTVPARSVTIAQVVATIWIIGVALFLIPVVVGVWELRRLRQGAWPWTDGQALVQTCASTLGVHRPIDAFFHEGVTSPMTCGVLKPAIILPATAQQWDEAALRCAIRHELEHVARWDFLTHCLSRMVCAVYWFHPLVWAAWRRLRLEAERACDDAVVREDDARDYASLLVFIAQREPAGKRQPLLALAGRDDLVARVAAVLDDDQARGRVGRRWATGLILTGAIATIGVAPITVVRALPQTPVTGTAPRPLRFETASLRRNEGVGNPMTQFTEDAGGKPGVGLDGRIQWLTATNTTARVLLLLAYELREFHQIDNAPGWVDSDRFDVVANAPSRATPQQAREMLQSLLAERFKLEAHRGSKEFPIYALVLGRPDGSPGPRMTPSQIDCRSRSGDCGLSGAAGRLAGRGVTMAQLSRLLAMQLGTQIRFDRPVTDRTGLSGAFDFTLDWIPDPKARDLLAPSQAALRLSQYRPYAFPLESNAPNFLAALREQLGLRLDNQLAPEPVLVIDKIEPPREN
jgi:bla regulator protein BlaR1